MLRAGFTDVLVIGNADEVDQRQREADGQRREADGRARIGGAEDDEQEEERHQHFGEERGGLRVAAGRMFAEAVGSEAAGNRVGAVAGGDDG